ncbi:cytochrome P450 4c21-like [Brevipalpus obovatus]|uniref:cytochrome P450 4c21-like n=1 Tax=Brevipalpus obovatus TaxID=246614 RepID=UPI003D9EA129
MLIGENFPANSAEYYVSAARQMREKGIAVVWIFYYPIIFVVSWKHNKKILGCKKFLDRGWPAGKITHGFVGLVSLADAEWKARRNLAAPSYVPSVLENFIPIILHQIDLMLDDLSVRTHTIGCLPILQDHIMTITLETSLGLKNVSDSLRIGIQRSGINFLDSQFDRIFRFYTWNEQFLKIYNWIHGLKDERETLKECARQIIKARIEEKSMDLNENGIRSPDTPRRRNQAFLDHMLDNYKNGQNVTSDGLEDLIGELLIIVTTNFETIVNSTMWFLYNMGHNPDIQEKLYDELLGFDEKNENMTISRINELTYLDQCVRENLRIHPPVATTPRMVNEDVDIDGQIIPKGVLTITFIYSMHHDEEIYPNPDKFDPSRFEPENFAKIPSGAYIPFGDGPRRCIGERLAMLELKLIYSNIIKRFRIEPLEREKSGIQIDLITRPIKPLKFKLIPRLKNVSDSLRIGIQQSSINFLDSQFDRIFRFYTWNEQFMKIYNWIYGIKDERETLKECARQIIKARIEEKNMDLNENGIRCPGAPRRRNQAFLDNMLDNYKNGQNVTSDGLEDLIGELLTIVGSSFETIVNSTMWFLHNMAHNPDIQEKLYDELLDFDEKNENMTISQINELTYLDQCVRESLRIHPPVANMSRMVDEDVDIDGQIIPKGALTSTFIYSIHHDEEIYPNPDRFDPSRFEPENFAKIPPGAYIPFGDGPRRCIGERLAMLESKLFFSNTIKRFRIEPLESEKSGVQMDILTRPMKPLKFKFIPRNG